MTYGREFRFTPGNEAQVHARTRPDADGTPVAAIEAAAALLGRRWKLAILCLLARRRYRYNAMMRELPGATPKMLTQQLRSLEAEGLVVRHEFTGGGKHTEYELTAVVENFLPVVEAFNEWVSRHWRRAPEADGDRQGPARGHTGVGGGAVPRAD